MKKIFLLLCSAFLLWHTSVQAQWTQAGYMIANGNDTSNGSNVFKGFGTMMYCGTSKGLFQSVDNGDSWTNITYNNTVTLNEDIVSILVASNGAMFAGSSKRLYKSTDAGTTWTWMSTLPDTAKYWDITEAGGNIIISFEKGTDAGCYYSSDFGSTWNPSSGITAKVRRFLADGGDIYLGGTSDGVYKSTDNGMTWAVAGTGFPATPGIWSVDKIGNKLFAASVSGSGLFESSDNGATWTSSSPAVFNGFCQVFSIVQNGQAFLASNDGTCNNNSSVRISLDNGATWNAFLGGITAPYFLPNLGKNASGTSFFTKRGNGAEVFRYDHSTNAAEEFIMNAAEIEVFPNPSPTGSFMFEAHSLGNALLSIYNVLGENVYQGKIGNGKSQITVSQDGIYFYKIMGEKGLIRSGKIVVGQ